MEKAKSGAGMVAVVKRVNKVTRAVTVRAFPSKIHAAIKAWMLNHAKGCRGFAWVEMVPAMEGC